MKFVNNTLKNITMETLSKENFWNALYEKYTGEVQVFCDWIDEYKKRMYYIDEFERSINWEVLFFNNSPTPQKIKFHHLPIAMQWGIFQQFCAEQHPSGFGGIESSFEHPKDMEKIPELIAEYFAEMKFNNDIERMSLKYE